MTNSCAIGHILRHLVLFYHFLDASQYFTFHSEVIISLCNKHRLAVHGLFRGNALAERDMRLALCVFKEFVQKWITIILI